MCTYIYAYTYVHACMFAYIYIYVYMVVHMYVYMYIYIHILQYLKISPATFIGHHDACIRTSFGRNLELGLRELDDSLADAYPLSSFVCDDIVNYCTHHENTDKTGNAVEQ